MYLGDPCISATLNVINPTVKAAMIRACAVNSLNHLGRLCDGEVTILSKDWRFICGES